VSPKATLDVLIPGMNFFAIWFLIGFETRGRTLQEIDGDIAALAEAKAPAS
jgi:hypothetical protein